MAFSRQWKNCWQRASYHPLMSIWQVPVRKSGVGSAPKIVAELQRRGIELFLVCDEGGGIITEPIGGIHGNFAMVGVFEKGKADVKFTARSNGGHASTPVKGTPIARLSAFVNEVETHSPFRKRCCRRYPPCSQHWRLMPGLE